MKPLRRRSRPAARPRRRRAGIATVDYFLVLGIIMPLGVIVIPRSMRIMRAVYEMLVVLVSWPFM